MYYNIIKRRKRGFNHFKSISEGPRRDQFIQFQSELEKCVLKTFSGPDNIAVLIKDLEDPNETLKKFAKNGECSIRN